MKVILSQNVENLGKQFEVKEVKLGYMRNFLLPNNLAKPANKANLAWLEQQKASAAVQAELELKDVQKLVAKIDGHEFELALKAGQIGELFEQLTAKKIAEYLKTQEFEVKANQIKLEKPIKELGEYLLKLNFEHGLEAQIKLILTALSE